MKGELLLKNCSCSGGENWRNCFENVPLFQSLSPDEMSEIASITEPRTFLKGEFIYREGDTGGKLYILHTGGVKISRLSSDGKEQVIRVIGPGEFIGELSLFSYLPFTDDAAALENSTMCFIDGGKLKLLMSKYISIAFKVMDELSKRLERAENLIKEISLNSVEERLARVLLDLSGEEREIILPMTKGDFASQLGMSQETLSRKLSSFQEEGLISLKGHKRIIIENREGLQKLL